MPVLFAFNLQTKFGIHSRNMTWIPKCRNGSHDPDHAQLGYTSSSKGYYFMWPTRVQNLKSLAVADAEILQRV